MTFYDDIFCYAVLHVFRIHFVDLAQYEGGETKVSTLIQAATSADNLCRMDPAWHPWL